MATRMQYPVHHHTAAAEKTLADHKAEREQEKMEAISLREAEVGRRDLETNVLYPPSTNPHYNHPPRSKLTQQRWPRWQRSSSLPRFERVWRRVLSNTSGHITRFVDRP